MKKIKIIIPVLVIMGIGYLALSSYRKAQEKKTIANNIQTLPTFIYYNLDGTVFTNKDIDPSAGKILLNYFNPECEHCHYMVEQIKKNKDSFKQYQLLLITIADSSSVVRFRQEYQLDSIPNLQLLRDQKYQFEKDFGTAMIPSFFLYNEDRQLVKKIKGETKIENLLK